MRKLIAVAMLGAGALFLAPTAPVQAMTSGNAGMASSIGKTEGNVHQVRRGRWGAHRNKGFRRYGYRGGRSGYHRRSRGLYGYGYGYPYYYRRPGLYLRF